MKKREVSVGDALKLIVLPWAIVLGYLTLTSCLSITLSAMISMVLVGEASILAAAGVLGLLWLSVKRLF